MVNEAGSSSHKNRAAEVVRSGDRIVTNLKICNMAKTITIKRGRNAGNGQFVSIDYANKHPKTTVVETIKQKKK